MSLKAIELTCIRNHQPLFEKLSFELSPGKLLLVEGKNGAGKTTLLKALTGLRMADHGQVLWQGKAIQDPESEFYENLIWLGHNNPIKEALTALENLTLLSELRQRNPLSLNDALLKVGLGRAKHKPVKTFSAGMKRRLALASLLVTACPLWVLDEPQSSLDKAGIALFESLAEQHLNQGGLIIMTSHHPVNLPEKFVQPLRLS